MNRRKNTLVGALLFIATLGGCANSGDEVAAAIKICAEHGGIKFLYAFPNHELHCTDGIVVEKYSR